MPTFLPEDWRELTLGAVARYINGRAFKPSEWKKTGLPIVRIQNLNDPQNEFNYFDGEYEQKHYVDNGDILISWSASLGVYFWDRGPALLNQHIFKVLPNESLVDRRYFVYSVQTILEEMKSRVHGSTMRHIVKSDFQSLKIPVPPLTVQRKIADVLDRGRQLQRIREQANQLTNKIIQSVFLKMFGDPLTNPKGWSKKKLKEVVLDLQPGFAFGKFSLDKGVPHLRPFNISTLGRIELNQIKYVPEEKVPRRYFLTQGDLLFNNTNSEELVGKSAIYKDTKISTFSNHITRIRLDQAFALPEYVWFTFNRLYQRGVFASICKRWVNQAAVDTTQLERLEIPLPPLQNQEKFSLRVTNIDNLSERQKQSTQDINGLFHSLMYKAFRGELD